jgi:hypothetical protein
MVALAGEALCDIAAYAGAGAEDEADGFCHG